VPLTELPCGGHVDRGIDRPRGHEQLETPQTRQHFGWKASPLSHRDQNVEIRELLYDLVRVCERSGEHLDAGVD